MLQVQLFVPLMCLPLNFPVSKDTSPSTEPTLNPSLPLLFTVLPCLTYVTLPQETPMLKTETFKGLVTSAVTQIQFVSSDSLLKKKKKSWFSAAVFFNLDAEAVSGSTYCTLPWLLYVGFQRTFGIFKIDMKNVFESTACFILIYCVSAIVLVNMYITAQDRKPFRVYGG